MSRWQACLMPGNSCLRFQQSDLEVSVVYFVRYPILRECILCHPKLHLLQKDSYDHYNCPQTLGFWHRFFIAFKNSIGSDPKSQPSKETISEPSFLNSGTLDFQIIDSGIFFAVKSYMGVITQRFFLSQSGCLFNDSIGTGGKLV